MVGLSKQAAKCIRLSDLKRENEFEGNFEENEDMKEEMNLPDDDDDSSVGSNEDSDEQ